MSELTKKRPTEVVVVTVSVPNGGKPKVYNVPANKAAPLLHIAEALSEPGDSVPWRDVLGDKPGGSPAAALRVVRKDKKLTQKKLAELVGVMPSNISAIERGERELTLAMAKRLGHALQQNYHVFL